MSLKQNKAVTAMNNKRRKKRDSSRIKNLTSNKHILQKNNNLNNISGMHLRSNYTKLRNGKLAGFNPINIEIAKTNIENVYPNMSMDIDTNISNTSLNRNKVNTRKRKRIKIKPQNRKLNIVSKSKTVQQSEPNTKNKYLMSMIRTKKKIKSVTKSTKVLKARSAHQKQANRKLNLKLKQSLKSCKRLRKEKKQLEKLVSSLSSKQFNFSKLLDVLLSMLKNMKIKISSIDFSKAKHLLSKTIDLFNNQNHKKWNKNATKKKKKEITQESIKRYKRANINKIEANISNICKQNEYDEVEVYGKLAARHIKNFRPRFSNKRAMLFMRDCTIQQSKLDKVQKGLRDLFGYPVFPAHGTVGTLLKERDLTTSIILQLLLDRSKRSKEYKAGNRTVLSNVYVVQDITEAVCLSIKNNIDLNIHETPASLANDTIYWKWHGDEGKGLFHISVTPLTLKHPNSTRNSVPIVCWRKPAKATYDSLAQVIDTEIMTALMNRPKINIITLTNGPQIKSYLSMLVLDTWGQSRLNVLKEQQHMMQIPTIEPENDILKAKYHFDRANNAAHYHSEKLQIISTQSFPNVSNDKDWDKLCAFKKIDDETDRYICIQSGILSANFSNWIALENDGYIIGGLRVRLTNKEAMEAGLDMEQLEIFGRGRFYPKVPMKNIGNLIYENDKVFIEYGDENILHSNQSVTPTKELKIRWTSRKSSINLTGDLEFICMVLGHNGSVCKFPSFLCDINMDVIHSKENCKESIQNNCEYRTNQSFWKNWVNFDRNKNLKQSNGVGKKPLVPFYPWCFSPPTLHLMQGPVANILLCLDNGLGIKLQKEKEQKQLNRIAELQTKKINLTQQIIKYNQTETMLEYGYETQG
eukprot:35218_1